MMRLLLARHGQTDDNIRGRIQGQRDVPLNEKGRDQARLLSRRLGGDKIDVIYASPLRRAWETAMTVAAPHQVEILANDSLKEAAYGAWEGLTWNEIRNKYPLAFAEWAVDRDRVPDGAENVHDLAQRVYGFLDHVRTTHRDGTVLVVAHGGPLRVMVCAGFGIPVEKSVDMAIDNTALSELTFAPRGAILRRHNDTAHLYSPPDLGE